jgi:hypothetical protein
MSSICPHCGRENVPEPMGYVTLCGRRVIWTPPDDWRERVLVAANCRNAPRAAHGQAEQAAIDAPSESDMRAFGASDAACYKWPDDTPEHKALRAAYIEGAADCGGKK